LHNWIGCRRAFCFSFSCFILSFIPSSSQPGSPGPAVFARALLVVRSSSRLCCRSQRAGLVIGSRGDGVQGSRQALNPSRASRAGPVPRSSGDGRATPCFRLADRVLACVFRFTPDKRLAANGLIWIIAAPQPEASPDSPLAVSNLRSSLAVCIAGLAHFGRARFALVVLE
jgi:hypothetical protein